MTTIPDWKLQLLARRRQEEAAVRGREKAERDRLSQMPAWKRGLLERRRAKLGLPSGEPSPVPGTAEAGPPDPDESAVLMEAIGPVHQNRFIRQERQQQQQRNEELLVERKPGPLEARERRSSPGDSRDQSPKGRDLKEERLSPREARERRLGAGGAQDSTPRHLEIRDWRQSPGEAGDWTSRLSEARKWRLSPGETPERSLRPAEPGEQSPRREVGVERRLAPEEFGDQKLGPTEAPKWRPDSRESGDQSSGQAESFEWRLTSRQGRRDCLEECGRKEETPSPGMAPEESAGLSETQARETGDTISIAVEATMQRPSPVEDGDGGLKLTEGWKWTLNSGKAREWTLRDVETQTRKPESPESAEKRLGPSGVEVEGEAENEEAGAQSWPLSALQNHGSVPSLLPPGDAGPRGSRQRQEEEEAEPQPPPPATFSPPPPAPSAPQPPGDPLMSRLFYGVKAGPGVGAPRRSGHTFTVNPRRPAPASAAPPATPAPADAAATGAGKKRYPTAEEILVLGGYLRLGRSCLVKGSPERHHKQLKISFSETALETTYQYPSESSVLEELGPEPEAPSALSPPTTQPDDEEEEEDLLLLQRELQGGLRTKALIVDESCRR